MEKVPCPKCKATESRVIMKGEDYLHHFPGEYFVSECQQCHFWYQNPRPTMEEIPSFYPSDYGPHSDPDLSSLDAVRPSVARLLKKRGYQLLEAGELGPVTWKESSFLDFWKNYHIACDLIPRYVPDGKFLDVGCASGRQLAILRQLGWKHLYGLELVPAAAEKARRQGFEVRCGPVEGLSGQFPDEFFDVISTTMVLEHVVDPFQMIKQIATKLKPGGQFLFSTITRDAIDFRIYGQFWGAFDFPRHLMYFNNEDIVGMIKGQFDEIEIFHQCAPTDFIRGSSWRTSKGQQTLFDKLILTVGESALRLPVFILALLGLTCRVSIRCRKKATAEA